MGEAGEDVRDARDSLGLAAGHLGCSHVARAALISRAERKPREKMKCWPVKGEDARKGLGSGGCGKLGWGASPPHQGAAAIRMAVTSSKEAGALSTPLNAVDTQNGSPGSE